MDPKEIEKYMKYKSPSGPLPNPFGEGPYTFKEEPSYSLTVVFETGNTLTFGHVWGVEVSPEGLAFNYKEQSSFSHEYVTKKAVFTVYAGYTTDAPVAVL